MNNPETPKFSKEDLEGMFGTGGSVGSPIEPYGSTAFGREVVVHSTPSSGIPMDGRDEVGKGFVVVEEKQPSGEISVGQVHSSKLGS